jgi:hypothetical protein
MMVGGRVGSCRPGIIDGPFDHCCQNEHVAVGGGINESQLLTVG